MNDLRLVLVFLLLSILAVFIQGTMLSYFLPPFLVPDFLVIIVVFLAFFELSVLGVTTVFLCGVVYDIASGVLLGPCAASFIVVFGIFAALSQRLFVESFFAAFFAVFFAALISDSVYLTLVDWVDVDASQFLHLSVMRALVSGFCAPFIIPLLKRLKRKRDTAPGTVG